MEVEEHTFFSLIFSIVALYFKSSIFLFYL
jgi:hypothetical protein